MSLARLFFVHVMRCGGTSFRDMLWKHYGQDRVYPSAQDIQRNGARYPEHGEVTQLPTAFLATKELVAGHFPLVLAEHLPRRPQIVTLLRDPVQRSLSHLRRHRRVREGLAHMPLATLLDDQDLVERMIRDYQCKYFAFRSLDERSSVNHALPIDAARLEEAKEQLASCDVVGITERFPDTMRLVDHHLGLRLAARHVNESPREGEVTESLLDHLATLSVHNRELYDFALRRFDREVQALPDRRGFSALARLRR